MFKDFKPCLHVLQAKEKNILKNVFADLADVTDDDDEKDDVPVVTNVWT